MTKRSWAAKLDDYLVPRIGPAQVGPYDGPALTEHPELRPCPLCGAAMSEHTVERPGGNASSRLHCPR